MAQPFLATNWEIWAEVSAFAERSGFSANSGPIVCFVEQFRHASKRSGVRVVCDCTTLSSRHDCRFRLADCGLDWPHLLSQIRNPKSAIRNCRRGDDDAIQFLYPHSKRIYTNRQYCNRICGAALCRARSRPIRRLRSSGKAVLSTCRTSFASRVRRAQPKRDTCTPGRLRRWQWPANHCTDAVRRPHGLR